MSTTKVTDTSFKEDVLESSGLVLVDFWAEWCGPCKQIAPALDQIAEEMNGSLKVAKINIDENPQTPTKYGVRGIPTLMLFKDGQIAATKVGASPKSAIEEWIKSAGGMISGKNESGPSGPLFYSLKDLIDDEADLQRYFP